MSLTIESRRIARSADTPELDVGCDLSEVEAVEPRTLRAGADADIARRVAAKVDDFIGDLFSLIEIYQARTRDTQTTTQEREANSRSTSAQQAQTQRTAEAEQAIVDRAAAAESKTIGDIFKWIGTGISLAIGAVGAVFTGGASLVAAIAIAVAVIGPLVMNELASAGVVDPVVAASVSIGIAALCTLVSFGCAVASLAGAVTSAALVVVEAAVKAAIEVGTHIASIAAGAVDVTAGALQVTTAVHNLDASGHQINATELGHRRDAERELQEQAMQLLTTLARSFARVSASLAECREEGTRATRIAVTHG